MLHAEDPGSIVEQLPAIAGRTGFEPAELDRLTDEMVRGMVVDVLADEHLTEQEERSLDAAVTALGLSEERVARIVGDLSSQYVIARVNAGRLPTIQATQIMLKKAETAHYEVAAALMKEVVHRETRGGYRGVSIPIAKGVRFRTGSYRGQSVVVGTSLAVADTGTLIITSHRAVYKGLRKTVETPFAKLVGVNVFNDGIQFHASHRQTAPLFRVDDGYVVAAIVNAAWQGLAS
jgi:hypothetical protein